MARIRTIKRTVAEQFQERAEILSLIKIHEEAAVFEFAHYGFSHHYERLREDIDKLKHHYSVEHLYWNITDEDLEEAANGT